MVKTGRLWAIGLLSLVLVGCGPKVKIAPKGEGSAPRSLALLPTESPSDIPRERVDYMTRALTRELGASGFLVLDPNEVASRCSSTACPESATFFDKYRVDGLARLELDSVQKTNAFLGYYNSVSGAFSIKNRSGAEVVEIKHTESERGGLLFNTGQIFEGLRSTVSNVQNDPFNKLSDRFATTLVTLLPQPKAADAPSANVAAAAAAPVINEASLRGSGNGRYKVCVEGTPGLSANLVVNRLKSSLREVTPGRYCRNYALGNSLASNSLVAVELRNAFGVDVQRKLDAGPLLKCDLTGVVQRVSGPPVEVVFECGSGAPSDCRERLQRCHGDQLIVFRAPSGSGPFLRAGNITGSRYRDASASGDDTYAVLAVDGDGSQSSTVTLTPAAR